MYGFCFVFQNMSSSINKILNKVYVKYIRYHGTVTALYFYSNLFFFSFCYFNGRCLFGECVTKWFRFLVQHCCRYITMQQVVVLCRVVCCVFYTAKYFQNCYKSNRFSNELLSERTNKQLERTMYKFVLNDVLLTSIFFCYAPIHEPASIVCFLFTLFSYFPSIFLCKNKMYV